MPGIAGMTGMTGMTGIAGINAMPSLPAMLQANSHAQRQARRVYLGNITDAIVETELISFLNSRIKAVPERTPLNPTLDPVVSVSINREKAYAFVEFHSEQDADIAVCMDGVLYKNVLPLKIRRPKDYIEPPDGKKRVYHIPGIVSTQVEDGPNKVFIGNLPAALGDTEVKQFLSSYGELKSFHLVKDTGTGMSKGYAFFEYADTKVTDEACKGLNGIELGGKALVCQRANVGAKPNPNVPNDLMSAIMNPALLGLPNMNLPGLTTGLTIPGLGAYIPGVQSMVQSVIPGANVDVSPVVVLQNLVMVEELTDANTYDDIKADVKSECERYGEIQELVMPKPSDGAQVKGLGKVFVMYKSVESAKEACKALEGRSFNDRIVLTRFIKTEDFRTGNLDK